MKKVKAPFFAKFLETQKLEDNTDIKGGVTYTRKYPSDNDEDVTLKYPSDNDDIVYDSGQTI